VTSCNTLLGHSDCAKITSPLGISGAWRNVLVALYNLTMNPFEKYDLFFKRCGAALEAVREGLLSD
jgi:hypothetical protein